MSIVTKLCLETLEINQSTAYIQLKVEIVYLDLWTGDAFGCRGDSSDVFLHVLLPRFIGPGSLCSLTQTCICLLVP